MQRRTAHGRVDARCLFGSHAKQLDALLAAQRGGRIEAAGEQHLFDQGVELGHVGVDLGLEAHALCGCGVVEHRHRHLHACQRRTQFVAGVGQQRLVRLHQRFDARRRHVEARRHGRHLVAPGHLDPVMKLAGTKLLDTLLQRLEPAREAAHHRVGPGRHTDEQQHQHHDQAHALLPRRRHERQERRAIGGGPDGAARPQARRAQTEPQACARSALAQAAAGPQDPQGAAVFEPHRQAPRHTFFLAPCE